MPKGNNGKEKKRPGPARRRTFYNKIGFHIYIDLHQKMKEIAKRRNIFLEDVYREAIFNFIDIRASMSESFGYILLSSRFSRTHVTIEMEASLSKTIRHIAVDDDGTIRDIFETAVRLYLEKHP